MGTQMETGRRRLGLLPSPKNIMYHKTDLEIFLKMDFVFFFLDFIFV